MIRSLFSVRSLSVVAAVAAVALTVAWSGVASAQEASKADQSLSGVASAQEAGHSLINLTSAFAVGLVVIGAAFGISRLASAAYESMARQPEAAGTINTAMIIAAALIEGFTFYALFICSGK